LWNDVWKRVCFGSYQCGTTLAVIPAKHSVTYWKVFSSTIFPFRRPGKGGGDRKNKKQNQPSMLLSSQDSSPYRHVGGKERSFLLMHSAHIRKKVQKLTK